MDLEVATILGKASIDLGKKNEKDNATAIARTIKNGFTEIFDMGYVKNDDIGCHNKNKITHIVTNIVYGKMFSAKLTSSKKTTTDNVKVEGDLTAKLQEIPIGGTGEISVETGEFFSHYNFKADLYASGSIRTGLTENVYDFVKQAKEWNEKIANLKYDEQNVILSYHLSAISTLKESDRIGLIRTGLQQQEITSARTIYNILLVKSVALNYLREKMQNYQDLAAELKELKTNIQALEENKVKLADDIANGKVDIAKVFILHDENVSKFISTKWYIDVCKKIFL